MKKGWYVTKVTLFWLLVAYFLLSEWMEQMSFGYSMKTQQDKIIHYTFPVIGLVICASVYYLFFRFKRNRQ